MIDPQTQSRLDELRKADVKSQYEATTTVAGAVIVKLVPNFEIQWRAHENLPMGDGEEKLSLDCVVFPEKAKFEGMLEEFPGIAARVKDFISELAGVEVIDGSLVEEETPADPKLLEAWPGIRGAYPEAKIYEAFTKTAGTLAYRRPSRADWKATRNKGLTPAQAQTDAAKYVVFPPAPEFKALCKRKPGILRSLLIAVGNAAAGQDRLYTEK